MQFLEQCDEVVLVKEGEVVERGTHAELMRKEGAYMDFLSYDKSTRQDDKLVSGIAINFLLYGKSTQQDDKLVIGFVVDNLLYVKSSSRTTSW